MAAQAKTLYGIIAVLIAVLIITSSFAAYYYFEYSSQASLDKEYANKLKLLHENYISHVLIDYGNGTMDWYNNTLIQPGWNLYVAMQVITDGQINATYYPSLGEHYVTGLNGVQQTSSLSWWLWTYNSSALWQSAQTGADQIQVQNGSIFAWTFCGSTSSGNPVCIP
ncbi:MAG: DUF4430 domain-containing protein [Nitrososphaerota archaeon]|nr:DUF4430 domain-containing protein [Nitrososphaerota archaeon]